MKKSKLTNLMLCVLCVVFAISATLGIASAIRPNVKASAAVETKKVYLMQDGATELTVKSGTIEDGAWNIAAGGWENRLYHAYAGEKPIPSEGVDMSEMLTKGAKLKIEVAALGEGSWSEVKLVTYASWWFETITLYSGSICPNAGYNIAEFDISGATDAQMKSFGGVCVDSSKALSIKNIWFEYQEGTADANEDVEVLTENLSSSGVEALDWRQAIIVDLSAYAVNPYDTLVVGYAINNYQKDRGALVQIGGKDHSDAFTFAASGTLNIKLDAYKAEEITSLTVGIYSDAWTMTSLKIVRGTAPVEPPVVDPAEDVEVLAEAKTSKYVDGTGHVIEVDLSAYGVMPYDTIEIGYSYTVSSPNTRYATVKFNGGASCSVGIGTTTADNLSASGTATVELDSYTEEQLTSISVSCWVENWNMTSLKIVRGEAPVESSNFALIEASEYIAKKVAGNAVMTIGDDNVLSLAIGTGELDTTGKYTARIIDLGVKRLQTALYNEGVITFSYKAPAEGGAESFDLRLMNMGAWEECYFTVTPVTLTCDGAWHEATVQLTDVVRNVVYSTWGGTKNLILNMDAITAVGFGLTAGSVELKDFNVSYEAKDRTITGIEVATQPTKTAYYAGDKFDPAGLELNLVFSDGFKIPHYEYSFSDAALLEGATSVEIKSGEYTASVAITVENPYSSIAVTTDPTKTEYFASEKFDPAGMVVTASLKNGTTEVIEDYTYSTDVLNEGDTKVVISYMGMTAEVEIVVKPFEEKYTNKLSMFDASYVGADGKLLRGYSVAPENAPASEVVKTDAETYLKLFSGVTIANPGTDKEAEAWKTCVRFIQYEVAYWNIAQIYDDMMDAVVSIKYRTTDTDNAVFGLVNRSEEWNVHYKGVELALENDGEWHVAYVKLDDLYGEYTHHGWWSDLVEYTNFSAIDGFSFMVDAAKAVQIDVQSVEICWAGDVKDAGFRNDIFAPEFGYTGSMSFTATEGDDPIAFENLIGYDKFEGNVDATIVWSDGAIVDGKLAAGIHTVFINAKDSKGNATEAYRVKVTVEAKQVTPPDSSSGGDSSIGGDSSSAGSGSNEEPAKPSGCLGSIGLGNGAILLAVGAIVTAIAKKRQKNND